MTAARRIGILGGTFDPVHRGHTDLAAAAQSALGLTQLLLMPANIPPHRPQPAASSFHRFAMVAIAAAGRPGWMASDLELRNTPPSYTSRTLRTFHDQGYEPHEIFFLIGADAFAEIDGWKNYPDILDGAHFAVVSRPGLAVNQLSHRLPALAPRMRMAPASSVWEALQREPSIILIDAPTADVSSTAIRTRRAGGLPINGMVDPGVQQHIDQHGLYTSTAPGRRADEQVPDPAAGRLHGES